MMRKSILLLLFFSIALAVHAQLLGDWRKSGITTVQGTITNFEKYYLESNSIEIQIDDWTNAKRRQNFTKIDKYGNFSISFFIFNTQSVNVNYNNQWTGITVKADDTLKLLINADTFPNGIKYIGKTAKICEIFNDFYDANQGSIFELINSKLFAKLRDSLSFDQYKSWRDSTYRIQNKKTEDYLKQISPDPYFAKWLSASVRLRYHGDLLRYSYPFYRHKNKSFSNEEQLDCLLSMIKTLDIDTIDKNMAISTAYSWLINALFVTVYNVASVYERQISEKNYVPFQRRRPEDKPPAPYVPKSSEDRAKELSPYYYKAAQLVRNDKVRESVLAHYYTTNLERDIDLGLDSLLNQISNDEIKASLISEYNSYLWRTANQNSLKISTGKNTLLDDLKNKYKGSVLYIDFWATWCSPCYASLRSASKLKDSLKNKKVVFIYLCCNSDKSKWEKTIADFKLDGEHVFLTSEQYMLLAQEFKIIGVPRYIIIDKSGRIVNENAPRPDLFFDALKELSKYINKAN